MKNAAVFCRIRMILCGCALLLAPALRAQVNMSDFIGINVKREDPVQYLNCAGFAREFHDWIIDEGNSNAPVDNGPASPLYPDNVCKWNPGYQGQSSEHFHSFYSA